MREMESRTSVQTNSGNLCPAHSRVSLVALRALGRRDGRLGWLCSMAERGLDSFVCLKMVRDS